MSIVYTQSRNSSIASATSLALAFNSNVSSGNPALLVATLVGNLTTNTVTDNVNAGNYANDVTGDLATDQDRCWISSKLNAAAGATTVTSTVGQTSNINLAIHEYAGIVTSAAFDQSAHGNNTNTSPASGSTGTTTAANELVLGWVATTGANAETITATGGATRRELCASPLSPFNNIAASSELIVSSTGTQSATFTLTNSEEWACLCGTYKGAASATILMGQACL